VIVLSFIGILAALTLLVVFAYRGWSVLGLAPLAALVAAAAAGEPVLAHFTQTFMHAAAKFVAQYFPLFLLGALFGKLMEDSGSVRAIARAMTEAFGPRHAVLAVVIAGSLLTYGGVSLFVAMFVLVPMGQALFRAGDVPNRLLPGAVALGTQTFTMSALPGTPAIQNAIPIPYFGTTTFAAPGLGFIAGVIMLVFGLWWLLRARRLARAKGEGFGDGGAAKPASDDLLIRERATTAGTFDPAEIERGQVSEGFPSVLVALAPLGIVVAVNVTMSLIVFPRLDLGFLSEERWGGASAAAVGGIWSIIVALSAAVLATVLLNRRRLQALRDTTDAGLNACVLPMMTVASLVGFGSVIAAVPAFEEVRDNVLAIQRWPLAGLAVSTNVLAGLTGSASGGLTIALDALGATYNRIAAAGDLDPALLHRVAVLGSGTLDNLPHNGAVVTLLGLCGATHKESYIDIVMVGIIGGLVALAVVVALGSAVGSF
jgi:H+/gluconate symporter-like permease